MPKPTSTLRSTSARRLVEGESTLLAVQPPLVAIDYPATSKSKHTTTQALALGHGTETTSRSTPFYLSSNFGVISPRHGASTAFIILITITNKQKTQHTNRTQTIDGERMERLVLANTDSQHSSSSTTHSKCWSVATRSLFLKYPNLRFSILGVYKRAACMHLACP